MSSLRNRVRRLAGGMALDAPARYARYVSWFDAAQRDALYTPELRARDRGADADDEIAGRWAAASGTSVVDRMLEVDVGPTSPTT